MSTHTVVLFALFALSLAPAADASCTGTKTNNANHCASTTCTADECATWNPNTCAAYNGQTVGTNQYACTQLQTYNTANDATTLAIGTTVAAFQTACCVTSSTTCAAFAVTGCTAALNLYANTANALSTTQTVANCCTAYPTCGVGNAGYTCNAGYTKNTADNAANKYPNTAGSTTANGGITVAQAAGNDAICCTLTTGTCLFYTINTGCAANHYANNANAASQTVSAENCCIAYPTCGVGDAGYTCNAGYTKNTADNAANKYPNTAGSTTLNGGITVANAAGIDAICCTVTPLSCMKYQLDGTYPIPTSYMFNAANAASTIATADICFNTYLTTCLTPQRSCWANRADYTVPTGKRIVSTALGIASRCAAGVCTDGECCSNVVNTCLNPLNGMSCTTANTYLNPNTYASTAPCTAAPYQAACCIASPQCSSYTCANGYATNAAAASIFCTAGVCGTTQCCTPITGACRQHTCTVASKMLNTAAYSTVGNTDAVCCIDRDLCTAVTCTAGITTAKNPLVIYGSTSDACCIKDTTKCYGSMFACPTGYYSLFGVASSNQEASAVTQDLHNLNCCALQSTCPAYWEATGTSSAGALRPALVTVVLGAIAGLLM